MESEGKLKVNYAKKNARRINTDLAIPAQADRNTDIRDDMAEIKMHTQTQSTTCQRDERHKFATSTSYQLRETERGDARRTGEGIYPSR